MFMESTPSLLFLRAHARVLRFYSTTARGDWEESLRRPIASGRRRGFTIFFRDGTIKESFARFAGGFPAENGAGLSFHEPIMKKIEKRYGKIFCFLKFVNTEEKRENVWDLNRCPCSRGCCRI